MESRQLICGHYSICPRTLIFYSPYDRTQKRMITIMNSTPYRLLFKIRSNATLHYCVDPNCGCIEAYNIGEVNISLNYFDFNEERDYRHHFTVLCVRSPNDDDDLMESQAILSIFQKVDRFQISSTRVQVLLQPRPIEIAEDELNRFLPPVTRNILRGNLNPLGIDHLRQMPLPGHRRHYRLLKTLASIFAVIVAISGAFLHRQSIEQLLYMYLNLDQVEF